MMIALISCTAALAVLALLSFGKFAKSQTWRATVTPLASIIGST